MEWGYLCSMNITKDAPSNILPVNKLAMGRFGLVFHHLFSYKLSLCWVIKFKPYLGQPTSSLVFPACAHLPSLMFSGPVMTQAHGMVGLWSLWPSPVPRLHCDRCVSASDLLLELPPWPRFISYWLISRHVFLKVESADKRTQQFVDLVAHCLSALQKAWSN